MFQAPKHKQYVYLEPGALGFARPITQDNSNRTGLSSESMRIGTSMFSLKTFQAAGSRMRSFAADPDTNTCAMLGSLGSRSYSLCHEQLVQGPKRDAAIAP